MLREFLHTSKHPDARTRQARLGFGCLRGKVFPYGCIFAVIVFALNSASVSSVIPIGSGASNDGRSTTGNPEPLFKAFPSEIEVIFFTNSGNSFVDEFAENENQRTIIKLMHEQQTISAKSLAEHIGMTPRGVQKGINALKKAGLVKRVGAANGRHWVAKQLQ